MDERCRCPACRKAHADAERSRTRTNAQTRLPAKVRQQPLNDIYAGRQFKTIVRDLGLTSQQGWGITKTDRVGFERGMRSRKGERWTRIGVNGQFVVPAGGRVKVPSLRVFLSGC